MHTEAYLRNIALRDGVFLRREAREVGVDDDTLARLVRQGLLVKVRHGSYTFADMWPERDVEQFNIHGRAVMRTHDDRVVLSHTSALLQRPVDSWDLNLSHTHVTRLDGGPARSSRDIAYHQGHLDHDDVEVVDGLSMTRLPRSLLETVLIHPVEQGVVVLDSALHKGLVTADELASTYAGMKGWPGTQHADLVLRLADGEAESVGESRARHLMWVSGIPRPQLQYKVFDGTGALVGITDFAWEEYGLFAEFDGKEKYLRHLREGESPGDAVFREKRREDEIRRITGWRVIRLVWADLYRPTATASLIRSMMRAAA